MGTLLKSASIDAITLFTDDLDRSKEFYPRQNQHQSALDLRPGAAYRRVTEGLDVKAGTGLACRPAVLPRVAHSRRFRRR